MTSTPGPWKIWNGWGPLASDGLMRAERIGPVGEGGLSAWNDAYTRPGDIEGTREDFELAAAAPELLEALEDIAGWGVHFDAKGSHSKRVVERARAAIAKAKST